MSVRKNNKRKKTGLSLTSKCFSEGCDIICTVDLYDVDEEMGIVFCERCAETLIPLQFSG